MPVTARNLMAFDSGATCCYNPFMMVGISLRCFLSLIMALTIFGLCRMGARGAQQDDPSAQKLRRFIHQKFIHGVPFGEASLYNTDDDVELLASLLSSREEEFYWPNIVSVLGMGRNPHATSALITFIEKGEGKLSVQEYRAKAAAVIALGYLASRDANALAYLSESLEPEAWSSRLKWLPPYKYGVAERDLQFIRHAVQGLGLSGDLKAEKLLTRLRRTNSLGTFEMDRSFRELVDGALKANKAIRTYGLEAYSAAQRRP